ncbi:hypothetical protein [uncultured Sneathiella sp.]|uniref:hypothetical protein n=1 Tax=uncultured Sneathiella sp. TaxID=879315 RepID=UPI0030D714BB|tara:strand:- start:768 stop:1577 length:810 start_codon:yes stop_codon:yes gene_type:complete
MTKCRTIAKSIKMIESKDINRMDLGLKFFSKKIDRKIDIIEKSYGLKTLGLKRYKNIYSKYKKNPSGILPLLNHSGDQYLRALQNPAASAILKLNTNKTYISSRSGDAEIFQRIDKNVFKSRLVILNKLTKPNEKVEVWTDWQLDKATTKHTALKSGKNNSVFNVEFRSRKMQYHLLAALLKCPVGELLSKDSIKLYGKYKKPIGNLAFGKGRGETYYYVFLCNRVSRPQRPRVNKNGKKTTVQNGYKTVCHGYPENIVVIPSAIRSVL